MAEAVVGALICKLGIALGNKAATYAMSQISNEASDLKDLFCEIHKAKEELESIKAYLRDIEKFKDTSETTGVFIKNIRGLAFRIEDVIDEFTYKLEDDKYLGFASKTRKRIRHVNIWRRLALELRHINVEIGDATRRTDRYAMVGTWRYSDTGHQNRPTNQMVCLPRNEDLVGIEDVVEKLKRWLMSDLYGRKNKIITVWGMGGIGKTTLVDNVYNIVKVNFDAAAWVTVSKNYQVEELLNKICQELAIPVDANMEMRNLVAVIRNHLEGKMYMIVLDDVWEEDMWINIMDVFPTNCISRFVMTSRKYEVASLATGNCTIKLDPLALNHSWELFCKLAFRYTEDKTCPLELCDLATKFLLKCEGLPIAIACIGRLLSCKPPSYSVWNNVYNELELQSAKHVIPGVDIILKVSLEDLPYELKNCFLHCAMFPEDYEMKRRRIIRHWITSGFIKDKENITLEEVGEGYLNELVNRSLLQVVKKNESGRLKSFRMHDVVRHLTLDKAEKECFGKVYVGSGTFSVDNARRLSIQSTNIGPLSQSRPTHIRAIHVFTSHADTDQLKSIIASSNLLSTLDLQGTQINMLPDELFRLLNLRSLGLRFTKIKTLPEAIGRLQNLEVLDAYGTGLLSLPKDVTKLKKLRYLYACPVLEEGYGAIEVPRGIGNLTGLHVLQDIKASLGTLSDVAALTELRTFAVSEVTSEHSLNMCSAIKNMSHLVHLSISASNENEVLHLETLYLPEMITKFELDGQLEKKHMPQILSTWSHLNNLTRLDLAFSKLDEDSFSNLMVLRGLCFLRLYKAYNGGKLQFPAQSFPRLRELEVWGAPQLSQVEIEEGTLESLAMLRFADCPELKCLPHGIVHLTALEELCLIDTAEELINKVMQASEANTCSEELQMICRIKKVLVKLTARNILERIC